MVCQKVINLERSLIWAKAGEVVAALAQSFAAVTLFVALIGAVYIPSAIERERAHRHTTVLDCQLVSGGASAVSLLWTFANRMDEGRQAKLAIYDFKTGEMASTAWPDLLPTCIAASHNRRELVVASRDHNIYAMNPGEPAQRPRLIGVQPQAFVESMELTDDDQTLVSLGFRSIAVWKIQERQLAWSRTDLHIHAFAICRGSTTLVCGTHEGTIVELDLHTGRMVRSIVRNGPTVYHIAISPNHERMVAVDSGGLALLFDRSPKTGCWHQVPTRQISTGNRRMWFTPNSQRLIGVSRDAHALVVWDLQNNMPLGELLGHQGPILGTAFQDDGRLLSWGTDGTIRVWDLAELLPLEVLNLEDADVAG